MAMRYLWTALLLVAILGAAFGPQLFSRQPPADEELAIVSPHWQGIRQEFARAFAAHYLQKTGKHLRVTWLDLGGGAGEIRKWLVERYERTPVDKGVGVDVIFGGGMDLMPGLAAKGILKPHTLPPELDVELPVAVNGQELRDKENRYFAACMSGFGFVYNKLVIERAKLPEPKTWEDLGRPEFQGWVSCGDPGSSGSLHQVFELVLQGQGWERGSASLARLAANVRAFNEGGTSIPRDVSLGQAAAGPCIDFYASAPIRRQGATHLQLVIPAGQNVAMADCIAILRGAPNAVAAQEFVNFVLSEAGQRLWYQTRGSEGGPVTYDLERLPVMPKIYTQKLPTNTVLNPFSGAGQFQYNGRKSSLRWNTLNDLWRATFLDTHEELWDARKAIVAAGRDADLGAALGRAPLSEEQVAAVAQKSLPAGERNALRNRWAAWARKWYGALEQAAQQKLPVPDFAPAPAE